MVATKDSAKKIRKRSSGNRRQRHCSMMRSMKVTATRDTTTTSASPPPPPHTTTTPTQSNHTPSICNQPSASKRKLFTIEDEDSIPTNSDYIFIDSKLLKQFIENFYCQCGSPITMGINSSSRRGFAHYLTSSCTSCSANTATYTSQTLEDGSYDINRRTVFSMLNCGLGFAGLNNFCEVMGMDGITEVTHTSHVQSIFNSTESYKAALIQDSVERIRTHHAAPTGILDLAVSFDGSWQKRGFTSRQGIAAVIEVETGLVVDYHVMSSFCMVCASIGKKEEEKGEEAYRRWYASHEGTCTINHQGTSGLMEVEASKQLWRRSLEKGLRYTTLVSDGDSKTFLALTELNPYDISIIKEECTNHVAKRLGTNLRSLVSSKSKEGHTLGGRRYGALTHPKIAILQGYYKKAVASQCSSVEELRKRIMTTYKHASSTDEHPQHDNCPTGNESWCFFQRALAFGRRPPSHVGKSSCFLSPLVAEAVSPVYERLTSDALLSRCLRGMTQNANESFHSQVWMRCPKHLFVGRRRLEIAIAVAAASFNSGSAGLRRFLSRIGCSFNEQCIKRGKRRDAMRVLQAEQRRTKEAKRRRQLICVATARAQVEYQRKEDGPSYASGAF